jgi:DnaK suppressor protein
MTLFDIEKYKTNLAARHAELAPSLNNRDGIAIEKAADLTDDVQLAMERELATQTLDRGSRVLRDVHAALRRIHDGSYGVCAHCEEEITQRRLNALPWASLCVACQEEEDQLQRATGIQYRTQYHVQDQRVARAA